MKKLFIGALIALTTISFVACGNNAQSSNNTANPIQNTEEEATTQAESVLYSDDNITVTTTGFEFDEMWAVLMLGTQFFCALVYSLCIKYSIEKY